MKNCEICNRTLENNETVFCIGEHETVCFECAEKKAQTAKAENKEIEITEAGKGEEWKLCQWCEGLFPVSELREEIDLGNLCDQCIAGIASRGEELTLKY